MKKLLLKFMIYGTALQQYLHKKYSLSDFQKAIPEIKEITSLTLLNYKNFNQQHNFLVYYRTTATTNEHKVTILRMDGINEIVIVNNAGIEQTSPIIQNAQYTTNSTRILSHSIGNLYFSGSLNKDTNSIRFYDENLAELVLNPGLEK